MSRIKLKIQTKKVKAIVQLVRVAMRNLIQMNLIIQILKNLTMKIKMKTLAESVETTLVQHPLLTFLMIAKTATHTENSLKH